MAHLDPHGNNRVLIRAMFHCVDRPHKSFTILNSFVKITIAAYNDAIIETNIDVDLGQ